MLRTCSQLPRAPDDTMRLMLLFFGKFVAHGRGDLVGRLRPDLDELLATLGVGGETLVELALDLGGLLLVARDDLRLFGGVRMSESATVTPERVAQWKPASLMRSSAAATSTFGYRSARSLTIAESSPLSATSSTYG